MITDIQSKKEFLIKNKENFGIRNDIPGEKFISICTRKNKYIATKAINSKIPLPSINGIISNCHGIVDCAGEIDTSYASFRVTHSKEEPINCTGKRPGVRIRVSGQIVVRALSRLPNCPPTYIAIPIEVVDEMLCAFYDVSTGRAVEDLKTALAEIDGSCMSVRLNCNIVKDECGGCTRYYAKIFGNIIDNLWKTENVWIEGLIPYSDNTLTFCDKFDKVCCGTHKNCDEKA